MKASIKTLRAALRRAQATERRTGAANSAAYKAFNAARSKLGKAMSGLQRGDMVRRRDQYNRVSYYLLVDDPVAVRGHDQQWGAWSVAARRCTKAGELRSGTTRFTSSDNLEKLTLGRAK